MTLLIQTKALILKAGSVWTYMAQTPVLFKTNSNTGPCGYLIVIN